MTGTASAADAEHHRHTEAVDVQVILGADVMVTELVGVPVSGDELAIQSAGLTRAELPEPYRRR